MIQFATIVMYILFGIAGVIVIKAMAKGVNIEFEHEVKEVKRLRNMGFLFMGLAALVGLAISMYNGLSK